MDVQRITRMVSEQIDTHPQELFDQYVKLMGSVEFEEFSNYCSEYGICISEDTFCELMANSDCIFTEDKDGGWVPTSIEDAESYLGMI
jgi:hypothetical protein